MNLKNQLLTQKQVCDSLNVGRTWLWRAEKEGRYPRGKRYTQRCVRYSAALHEQFVNGDWNKAANDE
ncbi:helix-turn-helix transcriptional regulator [Shewanella gaetbuli]